MRKAKETQTFDFRPLGLAIREARERAGLSRNDLGDKVFYGEGISQILKMLVHTQVFNYSMI